MLTYKGRLVNLSAADPVAKKVILATRPTTVTTVCTTPATRDNFLKKGVTLRYSYVDKDGSYVESFDVAAKDCRF